MKTEIVSNGAVYNKDMTELIKILPECEFNDSFYEGLTVTDVSDLGVENTDEMSTEELENLFSSIEGTPCKIITLEKNADEFLSDIKETPNGTMLFPQGN